MNIEKVVNLFIDMHKEIGLGEAKQSGREESMLEMLYSLSDAISSSSDMKRALVKAARKFASTGGFRD